ncbi:TIGR03086 family metal-binding protein [Corynebacterium sp.]|uniref:TIGR03086 family metal-binding protein n=1 Tax=Corynebacterium sp. TaxID=1720 RepID=UPI0026DBEE86|nr:TIGR03086 family metal-binding protein [Corynebacterium sp.]MDO5077378.1 TIGR03086 family metal-binding protein [Corynebacterium sp.]
MQDYRNELWQAQDWVEQLIGNTTTADLDAQTPCEEFTVRGLLSHLMQVGNVIAQLPVLGENPYGSEVLDPNAKVAVLEEITAGTIDGKTPQQWAAAWRELANATRKHWTDEKLDRDYPMPWGVTLSGAETVVLYLSEVLCHGYDLAKSTGQSVEVPDPTVAERAMTVVPKLISNDYRGHEHGVPFEPAVTPPADAGPTVRLAAFLGRAMD